MRYTKRMWVCQAVHQADMNLSACTRGGCESVRWYTRRMWVCQPVHEVDVSLSGGIRRGCESVSLYTISSGQPWDLRTEIKASIFAIKDEELIRARAASRADFAVFAKTQYVNNKHYLHLLVVIMPRCYSATLQERISVHSQDAYSHAHVVTINIFTQQSVHVTGQ